MPKERIRAEATMRRKPSEGFARGEVPSQVRNHLGATDGDRLVFEEGCDAAVQRAALLGRYFVVRLERGEPQMRQVGSTVKLEPAHAAPPAEATPPPDLEPFDAFVRKRCGRAGDVADDSRSVR